MVRLKVNDEMRYTLESVGRERERDCGGAASQSVGNISGDCAPQHRVPINGN